MNALYLQQFMKKNNITNADMAAAINTTEAAFYRKAYGKGDSLTIREMDMIIAAFQINTAEAAYIFFNERIS